ncbi:hypothetical protein CHISP_0916 [Chitinispirillum alkaliphilum]|nr:hypothetical protein CHISP_0916 [Chitinispirillum alkaliphilum]
MNFTSMISVIMLSAVFAYANPEVRRGRNEGTVNIPASNVLSSGNITAYCISRGGIGLNDMSAGLYMGGAIGVAEMIQFSGRGVINRQGIGPLGVSMQVTTPRNDRLRFFGIAGIVDLVLSTVADTLGGTASPDKPDFDSFITLGLVVDLDWIALVDWLPLKVYFKGSFVDDPVLLHVYDQLSLRAALEWKLYRHSYFIDIRYGAYKEKRRSSFPGDESYDQALLFIEPGIKYRFRNNFRLLGSVRVLVYNDLKSRNGLNPSYLTLSLGMEVPLLFRESNTEAVRTLIFKERESEAEEDLVRQVVHERENLRAELERFDGESSFDFDREEEALRRREEIENKISEIEQLLRSLD